MRAAWKEKSLSNETIALRLSRDQLRLLAQPTPGLPLALAVALARSGLGHHQIGGPGPTLVGLDGEFHLVTLAQ